MPEYYFPASILYKSREEYRNRPCPYSPKLYTNQKDTVNYIYLARVDIYK